MCDVRGMMKLNNLSNTLTRGLAVIGAAAGMLLLAAAPASAAEVEINWHEPDRFSDLEEDGYYDEDLFRRFSREIRQVVEREADDLLPPDATLRIRFRDVDLAGEYEFWRVETQDVRIMRDIYPPRLKFEYTVLDARGNQVASGMAQITDVTYLWNIERSIHTHDEFFYEKDLIERWMNRHLDDVFATSS